ncbi:MAG: hypothetical protein BSR46_00005, partial [Candidatus Dactylopiibacterium carminicum]|uniref:aminotransferase class I/II-fold pyridoxal phosphate-dependent enzyme n=1 Tax=Candidatus Dactylopiibacterium carminicum TaxID=857335 RepID=UPI000BD6E024
MSTPFDPHCTGLPLQQGGRLRTTAHEFGIPLRHWLDLSTGINPLGWPVPPLPAEVWRRLPEDDDGLTMAALAHAGGRRLLPLAGSQAAIQMLPWLFGRSTEGRALLVHGESPLPLPLSPEGRGELRVPRCGGLKVGILSPCYAEHRKAWLAAGHQVEVIDYADAEAAVARCDVLLLTNPNNPTGRLIQPATLRDWHARL